MGTRVPKSWAPKGKEGTDGQPQLLLRNLVWSGTEPCLPRRTFFLVLMEALESCWLWGRMSPWTACSSREGKGGMSSEGLEQGWGGTGSWAFGAKEPARQKRGPPFVGGAA